MLYAVQIHSSDVTGVDIHPTGKHVLTCSKDNSWALADLTTGATLGQVTDEDSSKGTLVCKWVSGSSRLEGSVVGL
jgi:WD40 repeat protein